MSKKKFVNIITFILILNTFLLTFAALSYQDGEIILISQDYELEGKNMHFKIGVSKEGKAVDVRTRFNFNQSYSERLMETKIDASWTKNEQIVTITSSVTELVYTLYIETTSELPGLYTLEIEDLKGEIINTFPIYPFGYEEIDTNSVGIASSIFSQWGIDSYSILDTSVDKGDDIEVRTTLKNFYLYEPGLPYSGIGEVYLNFEADDGQSGSTSYGITSEWVFSGNGYDTNQYIPWADFGPGWPPMIIIPGVKVIDVDIPCTINPSTNEYYAFNIGSFKLDRAKSYASGAPGDDSRYDYTDRTFTVSGGSTHVVFIVGMTFDGVTSTLINTHYEDIEDNSNFYYVESSSWSSTDTFGEYFSIDFMVTSFVSTADTSSISNMETFLEDEAQTKLGLSNDWVSGFGTQEENHGFDLLVGYLDTSGSSVYGVAYDNSVMAANLDVGSWNSRGQLHETLHCFMDDGGTTEHLRYSPISYESSGTWYYDLTYSLHGYGGSGTGYIMILASGATATWRMHPDNENRIHYDLFDDGP